MGDLTYFDYHWPLEVIDLLKNLLGGRDSDPNNPSPTTTAAAREWFSQPRVSTDTTVEVITCRFKIPLSVSEIGWEALRTPSHYEFWYQDRSNNWRPVLDMLRIPITLEVAGSSTQSWYKFITKTYPIVAKAVQFRIRRNRDPLLEGQPFVVGMRNALIKRNVYDRSQGIQYLEDEQDPYGNVITKNIRDWDAPKAADGDSKTFWKSAPQPDPNAVVSLYLDCRTNEGTPRLVDKLYLDPVYSGQMLNLYYSSDDTVGVLKPSPITVPPLDDQNTSWRIQLGRRDEASGATESWYRFKGSFGPLNDQPTWLGIEWVPSFDPLDGPAQNPVLLKSVVDVASNQWHPTLLYDVGAGEFQLVFYNGTDTRVYTAPVTELFSAGDTLRIVAGWKYDPDTVYLTVQTRNGTELATLTVEPSNLPGMVSFDGVIEMRDFRGLLTATVIKLEDYATSSSTFLLNPLTYVSPDPVIPDVNGNIPSTTLDNSIYVAAWTEQEHGTGGTHETAFQDKEWTPIWKDYVAEKGMLYFPQPVTCKYIKLEFTNLTEEPYPVYESGIEVKYRVFPISVLQQSSQGPRLYTGSGGILGLGSFISLNGVKSVNWLNPSSVASAVGAVLGKTYDPVLVDVGQGYVSSTLPNMIDSPIDERYRIEMSSSYVYRREQLDPYILAQNEIETIIKAEGLMKLQPYTTIPWEQIEAANVGAIQKKSSPGALPIRGSDWWIFPGQTLRIPASIMEKLTDTSTVIERKLTLESRVRFTTTSVHRYEIKTLKRDAAIAYFAGVREVYPLTSTYVVGEDREVYDFSSYDPTQWVHTNTRQIESGPVTTASLFYTIENPLFLKGISNWNFPQGNWTYDPGYAHWGRGSMAVEADGNIKTAFSTRFSVREGDEIGFSFWTEWKDLVADDGDEVVQLTGATYLNDTPVDYPVIAEFEITDIATQADSVDVDGNIDGWVKVEGTYVVPSGVNWMRIRPVVTDQSQSGRFRIDYVNLWPVDDTSATLFKNFQTTSTFSKVGVDFRDSGLVRSNAMWADDDPLDGLTDQLAYYVSTIPSTVPSGMWGDTIKAWAADDAEWGTPFGVVSITVDGDRIHQEKRSLRIRRVAGAGEAGIKVRQWTNYFPGALFRIGVVLYKPFSNNNQVTVRLRRLSDGVFIHEETFTAPTGRWFEYQTKFYPVPDDPGPDPDVPGGDIPAYDPHQYEVSATLSGDEEDELYLNDLYTEVSHIRYFIRLGGGGEPLIEVTDLRYADTTYVTATTPVNEMSIQAAIMSPKSYCFGLTATPVYLK